MKRIAFFVAMVALIAACNPYGSEVPRDLLGNYWELTTGKWELGLYEEFAIYQNDFWKYQSVADKQIVLVNRSGETKTLNLKSFDEWSYGSIHGEASVFAMFVNGKQVGKIKASWADFADESPIGFTNILSNFWLDSSAFKKQHEYRIDTAVVRLYLRNTAQGLTAFGKRSVNRRKDIQVLNYLESKNVTAYPIDSTDHYGYRYEFKIPVTGVSEIPMADLFDYYNRGWNSEASKVMNYVVEPGDTLMFYGWEDGLGFSQVNAYGNTECSGGNNWRLNTAKNANLLSDEEDRYAYGKIALDTLANVLWQGILHGQEYYQMRKMEQKYMREHQDTDTMFKYYPVEDTRYEELYNTKRRFNELNALLSCDPNSDSLKAVFPINEDEIFKTVTVYDFVINYIKQHADTLPSTPENLAQHPDWILAEGEANILINPESIKKLGLSDDFIEFYRLMQAVQFYDDFSPVTPMQDVEKQSIMRNITKADYKRYLEDKMQRGDRIINYKP